MEKASDLISEPSGLYSGYGESLIIHFDPESLITFANHKSQDYQSKELNRHKKRRRTLHRDIGICEIQNGSSNQTDYENSQLNLQDESEWIDITNRIIKFECDSPIDLSVLPHDSTGFRILESNVYEFRTDDIKLNFETDEHLLGVKNKNVAKLKSKLLLSINIQNNSKDDTSSALEILRDEVAILNLPSSKINSDSLQFFGPGIKLIFNANTNKINVSLFYSIYLKGDISGRFPVDITNKVSELILLSSSSLPTLNDLSYTTDDDNLHEPSTPQLFYKSISENTARIPLIEKSFDIPELDTNLLRFQRKTVNWLIQKEGMKYDWNTNRCVKDYVIDIDLINMLSQYFSNRKIDFEEVDNKVGVVLNKLCFGWNRITNKNRVFWFNKYTCNLSSRHQTYQFILDYHKELNGKKSEGVLPAQGLLAEEMGLGKTVEITTLVLMNPRPIDAVNEPIQIQLQSFGDLKTVIKAKTTLIIAPDSILKQWNEEIVHLAPSLAVTIYNGIDKYPKLENNAGLIAEYLRRFDIVFTTYSTISKELDYALYSSRNKPTRNSSKRKASYFDNGDTGSDNTFEDNEPRKEAADNIDNEALLRDYKAMFQLSLQSQKPKIANEKSSENQHETDYEKALQDEIHLAIKHNKITDIYNTHEYQSPLMLTHFWRVVLDEVQMVSSRLSRAFQSAALIPRFHAWGVSGTPIKKDFNDLHSILRFLKFQPFSGPLSKNSWATLTTVNGRYTNRDFIKLWSQISLRHTKAMVHDDIRLPPQSRVLMTIPFTPVEQENYNQMFEECLAAICLDSNGNPVLSDWEPSSTVLTYMRYWLVRLRQVCCNPQIGKLNLNSKKYKSKNYNSRVVTTALQLKTLENVLDDMLIKASDQISSAENLTIQIYIDAAQFQEYILLPEKSLEFLKVGLLGIKHILYRLKLMLENYIKEYGDYRVRYNLKPVNIDEDIEGENDDIDINDSYASSMDGIRDALNKFQDKIRMTRLKIRLAKVTLHKFYFLIASCNFQCYDEEYREKINTLKLSNFPPSDALNILGKENKNTKEISTLISGIPIEVFDIGKFNELEGFSTVGLQENELHSAKHKFLELKYYDLAEQTRQDILKGSIEAVGKAVDSKITSRVWYNKNGEKFVDTGLTLLPKTSKKFFNVLPTIQVDSLKSYIVGMKSKFYFEKFERLATQLNVQCEVINNWMSELIRILCKPLLSHDKTPDGEEYEGSIEDQDKASCYLNVISEILVDRNEFIVGDENSTKMNILKVNQVPSDTHSEANRINSTIFLNQLEEIRGNVKPTGKSSLQELVFDIKDIESELKDEEFLDEGSKQIEYDLFKKISERVRTIFANQKLAQILLQKELNLSCNSVFNSRIEYFKQLQQISDSVQPREYDFLQENLTYEIVLKEQERQLQEYIEVNSSMGKAISKFRYLQTLIKKDDIIEKPHSNDDEEELMCIICRSTITIGSLTQCGHKYCKECLELWLRNQKTCPMCKHAINISTVYNFTHHKPNLKANAVDTTGNHKVDDNLHSIYQPIDDVIIDDIQHMPLKNSYSSKVDMIVKQVLYLRSKDPTVQIVIFSQWQDLLYILGTAFKSANISFLGSHGTLTPEVGAGRRRNKYDSVEEFKDPQNEITCFLLNAKAQASGLTLVNATHIFLCEPLVNTSLELQAISRIHRIGQTKLTTVWMFAIENTVEESIVLMSTNKRLQYFETETTPSAQQDGTLKSISKTKERNLSKAESMTLMKSGGIDTLVNKGNGEGESVTNGDLWNAFFCARANNAGINGLKEIKN
ncbi:uncharacterized protein AC631_02331 [Debaryomyces fabryi]|uniref:RING-type domain-containing protein n=1 Tax=Debaryomyces fabryi TaxID=58627 RepID=A0A0V1Q0A9_9ASCO|nr:uncharacterized protein AC631_02331 [Debaryomyces fabryi]KSA01875.1 hypothetical protein AC631_02331 [Debaryomyces fabryi]